MIEIGQNTAFFLVFLTSLTANFGVSLAIYYKKFGIFKKRPENFLGITTFGFLEDAVILPIINILALSLLLDNNLLPTKTEFIIFLFAGFVFSVLTHILFSVRNWEIWFMEEPWKWNLAGRWHMISLALQMTYLFLVGYIILDNRFIFYSPTDALKISAIFILLCLFIMLFLGNDDGIKLGRVKIKNRTW